MKIKNLFSGLLFLLIAVTLTACGGGGGGHKDNGRESYSVTVTVSGLRGSGLVLQCNGKDDLGVPADGSFTFAALLRDRDSYNVTVLTQPSGPNQTCTVAHGSGTVSNANITDVMVTCATEVYSIGGTVSGLQGTGLALQNNGGDDLSITSNGEFIFPVTVADGSEYDVTVKSQPENPGQTCTVNEGNGTVSGGNVTTVSIICSINDYEIGGTATGVTGTLVLRNNGGDDLTVTSDGAFTFSAPVADTAGYLVTIFSAPSGRDCAITSSQGTVSGNNITDVTVNCVDSTFGPHYASGVNWLDFVKTADTSLTCDGSESGYDACIHGGERRAVEVTSTDTCTGLTADDSLGVFDWACDDSAYPVRMVSTGLKEGEYLSDLIDFTALEWKANSIDVYQNGIQYLKTSASAWWTNPIVEDNDGGDLSDAGTVYIVTNPLPSVYYNINNERTGLVIQPGVLLAGPGISIPVIYSDCKFSWVEGRIDATGDTEGVWLWSAEFSNIRHVHVQNSSGTGIRLQNASNIRIIDVVASGNGNGTGISLNSSSYNRLYNVTSFNNNSGISLSGASLNNALDIITTYDNNFYGISIEGDGNTVDNAAVYGNGIGGVSILNATGNKFRNISVYQNTGEGIRVSGSSENEFSGVRVSGSGTDGFALYGWKNRLDHVVISDNDGTGLVVQSYENIISHATVFNNQRGIAISGYDHIMSGVTSSNNATYGFRTSSGSNNYLSNITSTNNGGNGIEIVNVSSLNTVAGAVSVNNGDNGIFITEFSDNNILMNLASGHNNSGIGLYAASNNKFTGLLKIGSNANGDCAVSGGTNPGLLADASGNCKNDAGAGSDAVIIPGIALDGSFVGKAGSDDSNSSGINGIALYGNITDWTVFDNDSRAWGRSHADHFPSDNHQGRCVSTEECRIWDWSLARNDTGDGGSPVLMDVLFEPGGDDVIVHTWSSSLSTTLLKNAFEVCDDGIGNDNLLCESYEDCIYTPDLGRYQGHNGLADIKKIPAGGALEYILLKEYRFNGY